MVTPSSFDFDGLDAEGFGLGGRELLVGQRTRGVQVRELLDLICLRLGLGRGGRRRGRRRRLLPVAVVVVVPAARGTPARGVGCSARQEHGPAACSPAHDSHWGTPLLVVGRTWLRVGGPRAPGPTQLS